jgi:hypothetical protein
MAPGRQCRPGQAADHIKNKSAPAHHANKRKHAHVSSSVQENNTKTARKNIFEKPCKPVDPACSRPDNYYIDAHNGAEIKRNQTKSNLIGENMKASKMKAETIVAKLFAAVTERKQTLVDNNLIVSTEITKKNGLLDNFDPNGNSYREFLHAVDQTKSFIDFAPLIARAQKAKQSGANDESFIAVKAFEKIVKCIKAFGFKDPRKLDNHTRLILVNTLVGNGVITSKNAFATLVRVEFDALEEQQILRERANYTHGTGSTQLSSTREMLRILGLTEGIKGAREAQIILTDEAKVNMIQYFEPLAKRAGVANPDVPETSDEEIEA